MGRVLPLVGLLGALAAAAAVSSAPGADGSSVVEEAVVPPTSAAPEPVLPPEATPPWLAGAPARAQEAAAAGAPSAPAEDAPDVEVAEEDTRRFVDLRLVLVDAESGHEVSTASWEADAPGCERSPGGWRVRADDLPSSTTIAWKVAAPRGLLAWDPVRCEARVSRYARSLVAVYPLRREAEVEVAVAEADGTAARGPAFEVTVFAGGRDWNHAPAVDPRGHLSLVGVPHFRGGAWTVLVKAIDGEATRTASVGGLLPYDAGIPVGARVVLPEEPDPVPLSLEVVGCGGCFHCGCGSRCSTPPTGPLGRAAVRILRRDGSPAAGAVAVLSPAGGRRSPVRRLTLDAEGGASTGDLEPGAYQLTLREPGLVPLTAAVDVTADAESVVEVREPQGGDLLVMVVDRDGRPLPHADVRIRQPSGVEWGDLEGDVQRIDSCTDALGRRLLAHVEPGAVEVRAAYGGRAAKARAIVEEGRETPVRLAVE